MAKMDISETKDKNLLVSMRSLDLLFLLQSRHRVWISETAIWETNYCQISVYKVINLNEVTRLRK